MGGANIFCIVNSKIPADWSVWVKSDHAGRVFNNTNNKHTVTAQTFGSFTELVLQIRNATEEDAGTYNCRVQFSGDIQEEAVRVTVTGSK